MGMVARLPDGSKTEAPPSPEQCGGQEPHCPPGGRTGEENRNQTVSFFTRPPHVFRALSRGFPPQQPRYREGHASATPTPNWSSWPGAGLRAFAPTLMVSE